MIRSISPSMRSSLAEGCAKAAPLCVVALLTLASCGGDSAADPTTTPAPATTQAPEPTDAPTTTEAGMSREAQVALARCTDQIGLFFAEQVALERDYITDAIDLCEEAELQVGLEANAPEGLELDMLKLGVDLAYADYTVTLDSFDAAAQTKLQTAVDEFTAKWG